MKWIVLLLIIGFIVWRTMPAKDLRMISVEDLKEILTDETKQFIDVRTPGEYKGGHIKGFNNIPLKGLSSNISSLDPSKETFVICQSGVRSAQGAKVLKKAGFVNVINVKGGMSAF